MKNRNSKPVILVDMDGTICDFNSELLRLVHEELEARLLKHEDLTLFRTEDCFPHYMRDQVAKLSDRKGFYQNLKPIPGGVEALLEMRGLGYEVFICTTPKKFYHNQDCVYEKHAWVMKHLGKEWTERIILTRDKTLVQGVVLIDDKPEIVGAITPVWTHVYYDQPYNRRDTKKPRINDWMLWKEVLMPTFNIGSVV
jgi:5'-nucleotidase